MRSPCRHASYIIAVALDLYIGNMFLLLSKKCERTVRAKVSGKGIACGIIRAIFPNHGNAPLKSGNQLVRLSGVFSLDSLHSVPRPALIIGMLSGMS